MNKLFKTMLATGALVIGAQASAQIMFYDHPDYQGRSITVNTPLDSFSRTGLNDRASSVIVLHDRWEVCTDSYYGGRCMVLREGRYPSLIAMGLDDRISSTRQVHREARFEDSRYAPAPVYPVYDSRRRGGERLFQANVTSVRAVVGTPAQRCWMEREQVSDNRPNVGGALAGALIGGVLGHQIGSGNGRDVATVGGAVVGGAIGSKAGGGNDNSSTREVQRCAPSTAQTAPEYWDVTYNFRGQEHRMQVTTPPGSTITVNAQGEPRA